MNTRHTFKSNLISQEMVNKLNGYFVSRRQKERVRRARLKQNHIVQDLIRELTDESE